MQPGTSAWRLPAELQITVLTRKSGLEIQGYLEDIIQEISAVKLKRIQVRTLQQNGDMKIGSVFIYRGLITDTSCVHLSNY